MSEPHVVILGGGPAGLGAAFALARRRRARVTLLERNATTGGNSGSFAIAGQRVDFGSHRLHPACDPAVMRDIRALLGDDLLDRPRHGRIRLRGRWIHFPLKPADLALRLPPSFAAGVLRDSARKALRRRQDVPSPTFATVLEAGLGRTICRDFYFPYALKLWGLPPEQLSAVQAHRRVSAGSLAKMLGKVASALPGRKANGRGRFFYPRQGFGQISGAYAEAAQAAGADIVCGAQVQTVELQDGGGPHLVRYGVNGAQSEVQADHVWSTIPVTALARCLRPGLPDEVVSAADRVRYRAMILIYLVLEADQFTEYDAHYFPEAQVPITRLSEPKNYTGGHGPAGQTVLCAELPCMPGDAVWGADDASLLDLVRQSLETAGIPLRAPVREVVTRRLSHAYPIYETGYHEALTVLDQHVSELDGLLSFGRQGLFAHDNTHHALYMGYCAADCLDADGCFDPERWRAYRRVFETHVVED